MRSSDLRTLLSRLYFSVWHIFYVPLMKSNAVFHRYDTETRNPLCGAIFFTECFSCNTGAFREMAATVEKPHVKIELGNNINNTLLRLYCSDFVCE